MQTEKTIFSKFSNNQLKEEETVALKAGGDAHVNPLHEASTQQGENPLYGG